MDPLPNSNKKGELDINTQEKNSKLLSKSEEPGSTATQSSQQVRKIRSINRVVKRNVIPDSILQNPLLNQAIETQLPKNYNFEIHKTIWKIEENKSSNVALQFPEGLLVYACIISDIIEAFTDAKTIVLGDVTYGACCVDDLTAQTLGCDYLIHYGHSCLVPIQSTVIKCLYVFVEIQIDVSHLVKTIERNWGQNNLNVKEITKQMADVNIDESSDMNRESKTEICSDRENKTNQGGNGETTKDMNTMLVSSKGQQVHIALMGTVQFIAALYEAKARFDREQNSNLIITIPQAHPLSGGEVLGCTSPVLEFRKEAGSSGYDLMIFVADGRFHLESALIHNPDLPAFRYNPYDQRITKEEYDHASMFKYRKAAIEKARGGRKLEEEKIMLSSTVQDKQCCNNKSISKCTSISESINLTPTNCQRESEAKISKDASLHFGSTRYCIILGTLGRQGNPALLGRIMSLLKKHNKEYFVMLLSEIFPAKLKLLKDSVEVFVQIACPRLSVDWGHHFDTPLLSVYECEVALGEVQAWKDRYPMDYYARKSGSWTNYHYKDRKIDAEVVVHKERKSRSVSSQKPNSNLVVASNTTIKETILPNETRDI